jgi:hypothetical protein
VISPPDALSVRVDAIPTALAERAQWVAWRWERRDDRWTKVPVNARTGRPARSTDPGTWATLGKALAYASANDLPGVGYVFSPDDPFTGVDLDGCRDAHTGELTAEAAEIVARLDSYTELSPSGTGVHVIVAATLPPGRRRTGALEMYAEGRFFTVTGHRIPGTSATVEARQAALDDLRAETFPPAPPRQPQLSPAAPPAGASLEDTELIERARGARNGAKFFALWGGDTSGHAGDESAADLALLSMLAFWTSDEDQLDRVFRLSGLYRDKWERLDYRERTIRRALERSEHYTAPARPAVRPKWHLASLVAGDPATDPGLPDDLASMRVLVLDLQGKVIDLEGKVIDLEGKVIDLEGQVDDERSARLAAEARADRSARLQSRTAAILGNPHLGQERVVGVALSHEFAHRESAGDTGSDGLYRVPLARVAERAGVSKETASRGIKRLEALGTLSRRIVMVPEAIDTETGEIIPMHRELFVGPTTDALSFAEAVATIVPEAPKPKWGGTPTRCPDHPDAKIIRRTTWECAAPGCGHILGETIAGPMKHPATDTEADDPNTQDASFAHDDPNSHLAGFAHDDPEPAKHRVAVVDVLGSNIFAEGSAPPAHPPIPGTIAAEWLAGGRGHPPGSAGDDRWTR